MLRTNETCMINKDNGFFYKDLSGNKVCVRSNIKNNNNTVDKSSIYFNRQHNNNNQLKIKN